MKFQAYRELANNVRDHTYAKVWEWYKNSPEQFRARRRKRVTGPVIGPETATQKGATNASHQNHDPSVKSEEA